MQTALGFFQVSRGRRPIVALAPSFEPRYSTRDRSRMALGLIYLSLVSRQPRSDSVMIFL